jgi:hypothetical protein
MGGTRTNQRVPGPTVSSEKRGTIILVVSSVRQDSVRRASVSGLLIWDQESTDLLSEPGFHPLPPINQPPDTQEILVL